ncbi:transaminase [Coniophora puteana RWD-64-598 SS2]|uniref:Transaminase n=1 Tax=Coniophora puteana (strain RWD-64-598) TaxID=741705 RepID=A0A5M3MME9_CONPW|nr:transaminase [Coniophora puteana RWD-64-598 SS2]EIW79865.1 transaminase [Coniophora puteana RWD-64-598 SS2]
MPLTADSLNPALRSVEYAVRGELAIKAEQHRVALQKGGEHAQGLPFDRVISSNIGNPQQKGLDQPPLTFVRQIASLMEWPALAELAPGAFPEDVKARAKQLQEEIGSIGAYSHSQGVPLIRQHVADFIAERDGHPSDPSDIFLTAGASAGVSLLLSLLITNPKDGILIPIPQYPLYTATLAALSGAPIAYHLDEARDWETSVPALREALQKASTDGVRPRALVVINPGNPTGSLLSADTMREIVQLCEAHDLVLLADEVYQANLHRPAHAPFVSFKKVVRDLQSRAPLVSFHSLSKGVAGECGRRGGYLECTNVPEDVKALMYKIASVGLCPPVQGQVGIDCLVRPPRAGEPSYALYKAETESIHGDLRERTRKMAARLNALPGVSCVDAPGALYLFPRISLSDSAIKAAEAKGKAPDALYALELLDATGICVVPGSGFGQKEGEWHYRLTCLCPGVDDYVGKLVKFHEDFSKRYP